MEDKKNVTNRRGMLKGAAVAAGAVSAPMIATAQTTTTLRLQSTWPAKDIFHEYANDFAKKVNDMASGKLKIEVLPAGDHNFQIPGPRSAENEATALSSSLNWLGQPARC